MSTILRLLCVSVAMAALPLYALPTSVVHEDIPDCDVLFIPDIVDEIGDPLAQFPLDETLIHEFVAETFIPVCPQTDNPNIADSIVEITNTSGRDFAEVWYVADRGTFVSNFDGFANAAGFGAPPSNFAFRIDNKVSDPFGLNLPLLSESATSDNIWEAGESWRFVLQDYSNVQNLPADLFTSQGIGDASVDFAGLLPSSGSIIAIPVPEPASGMLILAGAFSLIVALRFQWG